jgi:hypothetical protein
MTDHLVSSTESSTDSSIESEPEPLLARTRDESDETRSSASSALAIRDAGEVCFVSAERRSQACLELEEAGLVVVRIEDIGPAARGRLGDALDTAVERALAECGALGPGIAPPESPDASLSDQLYRARSARATGIVFALGPLGRLTGALGVLDPADSAVLRFFADASKERPVVLLLDESDAETAAYGQPTSLRRILAPLPVVPIFAPPETIIEPVPQPPSRTPAATDTRSFAAHLAGVSVVDREETWRAWTLQLAAVRGPLPLSTLERTFTESYVPLGNAIAHGLDDPRARAAHEEFKSTFVKSYTETFPTFAATTKRPRMVLDAHDIATRLARLHGARSVRLLLVDSMRWDLAHMIQEHVGATLGARAVLTDEVLLWAALPTTTIRQLETLARGVEALRAPGELDQDLEPLRGRTADYVRRLRVGPREVHKLDLVEARLQSARGGVLRALPEIASASAEVIARYACGLTPRTLLFVFGDHGFAIDRSGSATQGGASPDEVLVGAFALLVGDVH